MDATTTVATIMTTNVVVVSPETAVAEVARLMIEHSISGVPVVSQGAVVGIITEVDIVSRQIEVDPPAFATFLDAIVRLVYRPDVWRH